MILTDIFNEEDKTVDQQKSDLTADDVINLFADKLQVIKNSDGKPKYDTVPKALDALNASQEHITRLEAEARDRQELLDKLTDRAKKADELEELVRRMSEGNNEAEKPNTGDNGKGGLTEKDAAELVKRILNEEKQVDSATKNVASVNEKLLAKFGDKAGEVLENKAKELGTTRQQLKQIAATNPAMVLALFGDNQTQSLKPNTSSFSLAPKVEPDLPEVKMPDKSILSGRGATMKAQVDVMQQIKDRVYKKHEVS